MSNIIDYLQKILSSRYGKDVRQAIHDGILTCYEDGKAGAIDLVARQRIDTLESSALIRKIVDSLPTEDISTTTVYMIPNQQSSQDNVYDEYMYINESWEKIGSSAVDLTDYLKKDGDSSNNTVTFTSGDSESATEWTDVGVLASGEKHSSFLTKTSTMFKNIRFLKNFLGNNDISALGDGTVTGGLVTLNDSLLDKTYPVGSIYMSVSNVNPSTLFGGIWVAWGSGRVPVGVNTSDTNFSTVEKTGGSSTVTLTTEQMPKHEHGLIRYGGEALYEVDQNTSTSDWTAYISFGATTYKRLGQYKTSQVGSGSAHNNLQPYITCYMWKRTA